MNKAVTQYSTTAGGKVIKRKYVYPVNTVVV